MYRDTKLNLSAQVRDNRFASLSGMMRGFRAPFVGSLLAQALSAAGNMGAFLLLQYFVDDLLGTATGTTFLLVALGFVGLAMVRGGFQFVSGWLGAHVAEGMAERFRNYIYDHLQHLPFSYHDRNRTGELITRATSDINAIRVLFAAQAPEAGRVVMLFVINFTAILFIDWRLALASIIVIPFVVWLAWFMFGKVEKRYTAYQEQEERLSTTLQENLSGIRVVRAFARRDYEVAKFDADNREKRRLGQRLVTMHALYWPISDVINGAQMIGGFTLGAVMTLNGVLTIGQYLAYAGMLIYIIWPIRNLGRLIVQMSEGLVSLDRVIELIAERREPIFTGNYRPTDDMQGHIVFDRVSFKYDESTAVLHDLSFEVQPGQMVALMGHPGAGKTSVVNLLPRFYAYTGGSIKLDGVELSDYPRAWLRNQIGIVEQQPFLFSRTIRANITYGVGRAVSDEEVFEAAKAAAIHDVILTFPEGYDTLVGERGVTLSGGQKQRVAIARTILKNPRLLILDDSTSAVDTSTEETIRGALERLMENRTTFIIAHRIQSVMKADLILVLDHGRILQKGTHAELMAQEGTYREIFELQSRIDDEVEKEVGHVGLPV